MADNNTTSMRDFFIKTSTTSVIAVLIVVLGFALLFCMAFIKTYIDVQLQTQIVQGDWGIMMLAGAFFFSASKQHRIPAQPAGTTTADISATVTTSPDNSTIPTDNAT